MPLPNRILALDLGKKRIGLAISDPLGITAQGLPNLNRTNKRADLAALGELAAAREVGLILMGNPINMRGQESRQSGWVREFAAALEAHTRLPVKLWDERLTVGGGGARAARKRHQHRKTGRRSRPAVGGDPAAKLPGFAGGVVRAGSRLWRGRAMRRMLASWRSSRCWRGFGAWRAMRRTRDFRARCSWISRAAPPARRWPTLW